MAQRRRDLHPRARGDEVGGRDLISDDGLLVMGETTSKVAGRMKKITGKATGNRSLEAKGRIQETLGKAQGAAKRAAHAIERTARRVETKIRRRGQGRPVQD